MIKYVFRGAPNAALEENVLADVIDVTGVNVVVAKLVSGVVVLRKGRADCCGVKRVVIGVDVRDVENSLLVAPNLMALEEAEAHLDQRLYD